MGSFLADICYIGISNRKEVRNYAIDYFISHLMNWAGGASTRYDILWEKLKRLSLKGEVFGTEIGLPAGEFYFLFCSFEVLV